MPRPRSRPASSLSAGQSAYVLEKLLKERRISASDVSRIMSDMGREISELEAKLESLKAAHEGAAAPAEAVKGGPGRPAAGGRRRRRGRKAGRNAAAAAQPSGAKKRRRSKKLTPEQMASRQLQGRYISLVRQFPASKRAQFKRLAQENGREVAIREMQNQLKK